jgi:hypothetical protein
MTLDEFLFARIAEDEAASTPHREATGGEWHSYRCDWLYGSECDCGHPAHVLAECEAKRQIVELHMPLIGTFTACQNCYEDVQRSPTDQYPCDTLRLLSLPYASHPDYREEWRP